VARQGRPAYTLIGADGAPYPSARPGTLGGHRRSRGYGRLDCPTALRWIARGHYVRHRVFFADEASAIAAGFRPCAHCLPGRYAAWKEAQAGAGEWPDATVDGAGCELPVRGAFDARFAIAYLAARAIPGVERVESGTYRRTLALPHGPAVVDLDARASQVRLRLLAGDSRDREVAIERCGRLLGLDADPAEARAALAGDPLVGPLVAARPGLRVPGAVDGCELAVRAVVNQQVSLAAARTVLGRLAEAYGRALPHGRERLFPSAERLAALDPDALPLPAQRARALVGVCSATADGRLDLRPGADPAEARAVLLTMPGVGDWTASYIAMRALGDPDAFPPTDLGVRRALAALGQPTDRRSVEALGEHWRPWRAYATLHLWASAISRPPTRAGRPPRHIPTTA
jgi:AraC family transcriptional regulator, regulatory protein of adaptative response / DNA-3-methyladenine glycosylase II